MTYSAFGVVRNSVSRSLLECSQNYPYDRTLLLLLMAADPPFAIARASHK